MHFNSLAFKESTAGVPAGKALLAEIEENADNDNESENQILYYLEPFSDKKDENNSSSSNASETTDKVDNRINADNNINISNVNLPADSNESSTKILLQCIIKSLKIIERRLKFFLGHLQRKFRVNSQ